MRAKFKIDSITRLPHGEILKMSAVCPDKFDEEGLSEDSSFSKWTPTGSLEMTITNPAVFATLNPGDSYYLDFTLAAVPDPAC